MNNKSDAKAELSARGKEWMLEYKHTLFNFLRDCLRDDFTADKIDRILSCIVIRPGRHTVDLLFNVELLSEEKLAVVNALSIAPHIEKWSISSGRITIAWGRDYTSKVSISLPTQLPTPPQFGERLLLLILSKEERVNIPGDLAEEYIKIAATHTVRYAKFWYYKQIAASAWPLIRKVIKWGLLASLWTWIRRT